MIWGRIATEADKQIQEKEMIWIAIYPHTTLQIQKNTDYWSNILGDYNVPAGNHQLYCTSNERGLVGKQKAASITNRNTQYAFCEQLDR